MHKGETISPIKVALYDDNADLRLNLSNLLSVFPEFHLIGAFLDAQQVLENCAHTLPEVILMDIDMPGISGIEAVRKVHLEFPAVKVLMLTVFDDNPQVFQSICNGAVGYILKKSDPMDILAAVRDAYAGGSPMTPVIATKVLIMFREHVFSKEPKADLSEKEMEILAQLTRGYSYKMIAAECRISIDTVRFHIKNIYEKLHVHSMTEAVSKALKNNWV